MGATTLSRTYNARLTALLDKVRPVLEAQITTSNAFYFKYKKAGNWKIVSELGDRYRVPLMYEFAPVDTFGPNGVGQVDITPTDGQTPAFFNWCRLASSITIGDFERAQNKGASLDLLKNKTEQAMLGLEDKFGRWLLQGKAALDDTSFTTAYTSATNGSTFVDPIPLMILADSDANVSLGEINGLTESWWRNQAITAATTSYATQMKAIDHLINLCSKGAGGSPDLYVADLLGYEQVAACLRSLQRFVDYEDVSFPFKSIKLAGAPLTFDQFIGDVGNATPTRTVASGAHSTLYAINSKFIGVAVYSGKNFTPGEFVRTPNGAGESALVQWYGTHWISRRDKHGVLCNLDNSVVS